MWRWVGRILLTLFIIGFVGALAAGGYVGLYVWRMSRDLPQYQVLKDYAPKVMTRIHTGDGTIMAEYAAERRIFVPIESIPSHVIDAFLSAEDKTFYEHDGLDYKGITRAFVANLSNYMNNRRLEGASTITQQVAKNFLLSGEVKLERKVKEALLAWRIEEAFSKDDILELYLNEIYLGWRSYGVAAAALNYFDKSLDELTIAEAAYLASMPKAPNNYRPDRSGPRARGVARRNWVLERMAANGHISATQMRDGQAEELVVYDRPTGAQTVEYEYFAEEVRRQVADIFGDDSLYHGGLSVRTTLEPQLQRAAVEALRKGLTEFDQRQGYRGPVDHVDDVADWPRLVADYAFFTDVAPWSGAIVLQVRDDQGLAMVGLADGHTVATLPLEEMTWAREHRGLTKGGYPALGPEIARPGDVLRVGDLIYVEPIDAPGQEGALRVALRQVPQVDGAIIALDPHTGRVLAMHGGFSFERSEFNRATQANRQPGSAFKPFVFAAALDNGYTPSTVVLDAPTTQDQGEGMPLWKPKNYTGRFYGPTTLRRGLEKSYNMLTLRLALDVGIPTVARYAQTMGVLDATPELNSIALGAGETTLMRMVIAYSMFVNGGKRVEPILIDQVQDRYGRSVFRSDQRACQDCRAVVWDGQTHPELPDPREQVIDPHTAYQITSMLQGVVERGTGRSVRAVGKPLGGKTGTTNDERDAWFVGFSPNLSVGIFVGYDQPKPMGRRETGGGLAAPIFRDFMALALEGEAAVPFRVPPGIELYPVDAETGLPADSASARGVIQEAFKPGTKPDPDAYANFEDGSSDSALNGKGKVTRGTGGLY
ncbi:MAG: penicillin-binding protein 1A [Alphaproteobacteria bacterium]